MDWIGSTFVRPSVLVVAVGVLTTLGNTEALSSEANCRRLEDLARQYAGVQLTSQQQQLKRRLIAWYNSNCRTRHAGARR
jgi:hypothetical protein